MPTSYRSGNAKFRRLPKQTPRNAGNPQSNGKHPDGKPLSMPRKAPKRFMSATVPPQMPPHGNKKTKRNYRVDHLPQLREVSHTLMARQMRPDSRQNSSDKKQQQENIRPKHRSGLPYRSKNLLRANLHTLPAADTGIGIHNFHVTVPQYFYFAQHSLGTMLHTFPTSNATVWIDADSSGGTTGTKRFLFLHVFLSAK